MTARRALLACAALPLVAGADAIDGSLAIAYRNVVVDGDRSKYDEDVNLDDGARLDSIALAFAPDNAGALAPDRIELDALHLGGDPFEFSRLRLSKSGAYRFRAERRRSAFFYDDLIVRPEDASIAGSTGGDFHRYDVERVRDDIGLDVVLGERAGLSLGFERSRKTGDSTTTLDVQRDEFELDKPVDETLETWRIAGHYRWDRFRLRLEETIRDYDNQATLFLPGFSVGENPANLSTLDFLFLDRPYRYRSYEHGLRAEASPGDRLNLAVALVGGTLDLRTEVSERSQGTGFTGQPFTTDLAGGGDVDRDTFLADVALRWDLGARVSATASLRHTTLEQNGNVAFGSSEGGSSAWDIEQTAVELGFAWLAGDSLSLAGGWSGERRDLTATAMQAGGGTTSADEQSDGDGLYLRADWRPGEHFSLSAWLNDRSIDDPYSLASPDDVRRHRLRATYRFANGLVSSASWTKNEFANAAGEWSSDSEQVTLRLDYATEPLAVSLGATFADNRQDFRRLVTGGTRQDLFDVAYRANADYFDAGLRWSVRERLAVGGFYRRYDNAGSLAVERRDRRLFVDLGLARGYSLELSWRDVEYAEGGIESYSASIVDAVLRLSFR